MRGIRDWGGRFVIPIPTLRGDRMIFTATARCRRRASSSRSELEDERGFFARSFCAREFAGARSEPARRAVQHLLQPAEGNAARPALSASAARRGEARPLHARARSTTSSSTCGPTRRRFRRHVGVELSARNRRMLYVPEGFAHGFQTLEDDTEVFYQMSAPSSPMPPAACAGTIRPSASRGRSR